jgi:hypothetical protein
VFWGFAVFFFVAGLSAPSFPREDGLFREGSAGVGGGVAFARIPLTSAVWIDSPFALKGFNWAGEAAFESPERRPFLERAGSGRISSSSKFTGIRIGRMLRSRI